jgi:hypothetical protein
MFKSLGYVMMCLMAFMVNEAMGKSSDNEIIVGLKHALKPLKGTQFEDPAMLMLDHASFLLGTIAKQFGVNEQVSMVIFVIGLIIVSFIPKMIVNETLGMLWRPKQKNFTTREELQRFVFN